MMMPYAHNLKTVPDAFEALWDGSKTFEYRRDDRDPPFGAGDTLRMWEWAEGVGFSGRLVTALAGYIARGRFGIPPGYCVISLLDPRNNDAVDCIDDVRNLPGEGPR